MSVDAPLSAAPAMGERGRLRLLQLAALTSTCDRFSIAPLLVVIALDLGASLPAVAAVASGYFLAYGLMQPVWGMISDRIGRVRVMRLALLGAAAAGVGSALAPDLLVLGVTRVVAGGCFAALIPASLVYVGDMWPADVRQRPAQRRTGRLVARGRDGHGRARASSPTSSTGGSSRR